MKQDVDWVTISESFDPSLLFKLIERIVLKQSNNQYKMAMLIAEQLSILLFHQDDQIGNAVYYDCFTTRLEVACQAGMCYCSPELLAWLGIPILVSISGIPIRSRIPIPFLIRKISVGFFFKFQCLECQKIGIPICEIWNSGNFFAQELTMSHRR
jgi:hypothetical protein